MDVDLLENQMCTTHFLLFKVTVKRYWYIVIEIKKFGCFCDVMMKWNNDNKADYTNPLKTRATLFETRPMLTNEGSQQNIYFRFDVRIFKKVYMGWKYMSPLKKKLASKFLINQLDLYIFLFKSSNMHALILFIKKKPVNWGDQCIWFWLVI